MKKPEGCPWTQESHDAIITCRLDCETPCLLHESKGTKIFNMEKGMTYTPNPEQKKRMDIAMGKVNKALSKIF